MATEVDNDMHLFRPEQLLPPYWVRLMEMKRQGTWVEETDYSKLFQLDEPEVPEPPFDFSPLHDVESLWWLTAHFVFEWACQEIPDPADQRELVRVARLQTHKHKLFNDLIERQAVICDSGKFASIVRCLRGNVQLAGQALEDFRQQLVACYANSEKDSYAVAHPDFAGLHDSLVATINRIRDLLSSPEVEPDIGLPKSRKRSRGADVDVMVKRNAPPKRSRRAKANQ